MKYIAYVFFVLACSTVLLTSCLKKDFDSPPDLTSYDPELPVTASIAAIKAWPTNKPISEDLTIYGIVTADDRNGNFYKQIVIEDSTGGLTILLDANSLYNDYPVGRKIYIKCKDLYLGNYNDLPQLGYTPDNTGAITGIPSTLLNTYIIKANYPNPIVPINLPLSRLAVTDYSLLNRIVTIDGVEFDSLNAFKKYADPAPSSGTSRTLKDCNGSTIILRSSGYAKFQPLLTPGGRGSVTAIYTSYKGTPQLVIRDTSDVHLYGTRCNGTVINPPAPAITYPIDSIKKLWTGASVTLGTYKIKGVVISDKAGNNTTSGKLLTVQDGDAGIVIFFSGSHTFSAGDSVVVDVTGGTLSDFNGILEITNVGISNAEKVGTAANAPKVLTIKELVDNFEQHKSTLVKIPNATISGGGTFLGSKTLTDGSGATIVVYTYNSAVFANSAVPTTAKSFTAIASQYGSTKQLLIRNTTDIQ
jgi:DNA/RNA endonuclease YhcR with UshA esterase domain